VQKMMVGLKGEEYGGWRNLHNEELHILYASQNTIWVVESRRMPWVGHAASVRRWEMHIQFWCENLHGRDHSEHVGLDRRVKLELIFEKQGWKMWIGFIWLRIWTSGPW